MSADHENDYLWDRSGMADPEIRRLEHLLGTLRHHGQMPALPRAEVATGPSAGFWRARAGRLFYAASAVAATLSLAGIGAAAWVTLVQPRIGWSVQSLAGSPIVDGRAVQGSTRLGVGGWLTTGEGSRARVAVGQIGLVEVEPHTRLQLVEARGREHRMALTQGTIHARIWAPPRFFFVNTPSAVAVDLGCAYTLQVHPDGSGLVRVTHGWVGFEYSGRESFIPEGAMCATRPETGPGTPRYEDAPAAYADALSILDFAGADDSRRPDALERVLLQARPRDALTLWHLLQRGTSPERARVYERMAVLVPPPPGVTRADVLSGKRDAIDRWWDSLGLDSATWWRLWKRKW
jgi:hypothetical protein